MVHYFHIRLTAGLLSYCHHEVHFPWSSAVLFLVQISYWLEANTVTDLNVSMVDWVFSLPWLFPLCCAVGEQVLVTLGLSTDFMQCWDAHALYAVCMYCACEEQTGEAVNVQSLYWYLNSTLTLGAQMMVFTSACLTGGICSFFFF